ncbi:MAG: putative tellurium resistance membrane protein TerC [Cellvibrionaceae bacterium]|jgi:predicted tellurium resistance membrane protein TerC
MNLDFAAFLTAEGLIALATLLALEIVLGIDNVIFISILADKLPDAQKQQARQWGIGLAVVTRILLLLSISWVIGLTEPIFLGFSGQSIILLLGGTFLIGKSTYEISEKLEAADHTAERAETAKATLGAVITQIILVDIVFSLDSVITAVGIADSRAIMITAIVIAAGIMIAAAGAVSEFIKKNPTMKILALAFLILIGTLLVFEGWNPDLAHELHIKNYAYFAMAFSLGVEVLNMQLRQSRKKPVELHNQPTLAEVEDLH